MSEPILDRLAEAACNQHTGRVIEIGPGRGALTRRLLPRTDELHAIEIDPDLVSLLQASFHSEPKLHIHHADVLPTNLSQWGPSVIVGNLPYYITSPILEKFLALDERFPVGVFLVQWEVAERLLAGPGTRDYAYLSVATQLVCEVKLVSKVPPGAFSPPPKVNSGGVRLQRKQLQIPELQPLLTFVGRCFRQKRKTLRNNLKPFYLSIDAQPEAGLRAEQLSISEFVDLYRRLEYRGRVS